jgi:phenylpropionate dioxygenase-like ring-hydroxylating dioxygenase large terminal subunit
MNNELNQEWLRMSRRLIKHIADKTSDLSGVNLVASSELYTDPKRFEAERQLLRTTPQFVGLSKEAPDAGDTLLFAQFGSSIIVVRTETGALKAFLNRCPHRGSKLVTEPCQKKAFTCPYHAWRFDLDGLLVNRPMSAAFDDNGAENHLTPVPVGEWCGLIFVICSPGEGGIDIETFLGSMAPLIKSMELANARLVCSESIDVNANWKLSMDANCEPYHVPAVHPQTINNWIVPYVYLQDTYGKHHRYSSPGRKFKELVALDESEWPDSNYSAVHFIYPNTVLTITGDPESTLNISSFYPRDRIGQSLAVNRTYIPFGLDRDGIVEQNKMGHDFVMNVLRTEDFPMAEQVWENFCELVDPARLQLGQNEHLLQCYHRDIAEDVGMPLDE